MLASCLSSGMRFSSIWRVSKCQKHAWPASPDLLVQLMTELMQLCSLTATLACPVPRQNLLSHLHVASRLLQPTPKQLSELRTAMPSRSINPAGHRFRILLATSGLSKALAQLPCQLFCPRSMHGAGPASIEQLSFSRHVQSPRLQDFLHAVFSLMPSGALCDSRNSVHSPTCCSDMRVRFVCSGLRLKPRPGSFVMPEKINKVSSK